MRNDLKINTSAGSIPTRQSRWKEAWKRKELYLMLLPGIALLLLFKYLPMYGLAIAFQDFSLKKGVFGSEWVGLRHFIDFFTIEGSKRALMNTLIISFLRLLWGFPAPILLAVLLNEVGNKAYKKVVQTVSYIPHFISWVIASGMMYVLLSPSTGVAGYLFQALGLEPVYFMADPKYFRSVLVVSDIWKGVGWGTIVYLAGISNINPELYEAAVVDGATRFQRITRITVPSLMPLISIVLILRMSHIMEGGFDQIFNMYNSAVMEVADIIDTYVYRLGMQKMQYDFGAAVGLFKSAVSLILVIVVNQISRKISNNEAALF